LHTFNAGIGFVLCVSAEEAESVQSRLSTILDGEQVYRLGILDEKGSDEASISFLNIN
jgi:phosphoribosylaminoimidazole (AIR) synthetase